MNTKTNPLEGTDGQLMVMAAHRYCLGRRTYIVSACVEWLKQWWPEFENNTRNIIVRDTIEALQDDLAGDPMDVREWENFLKWAWNQLDSKSQEWCKNAVMHRSKPFPPFLS